MTERLRAEGVPLRGKAPRWRSGGAGGRIRLPCPGHQLPGWVLSSCRSRSSGSVAPGLRPLHPRLRSRLSCSRRRSCACPAPDAPLDSSYSTPERPVYRGCGVDHGASVTPGGPSPAMPRGDRRCHEAHLTFVVDSTGTVIPGSVRTIFSNSPQFLANVSRVVFRYKYRPAIKDGVPVTQSVALSFVARVNPLSAPRRRIEMPACPR